MAIPIPVSGAAKHIPAYFRGDGPGLPLPYRTAATVFPPACPPGQVNGEENPKELSQHCDKRGCGNCVEIGTRREIVPPMRLVTPNAAARSTRSRKGAYTHERNGAGIFTEGA